MDTSWAYWGWCLLPLLVFGALALTCAVMASRRGCGCAAGMPCHGGQTPGSPGGPAQ